MTFVIKNSHKAEPDTRLPPVPHEVNLGDIRLILLPPGDCDFRQVFSVNMFDVNLGQCVCDMAMNSDRYIEESVGTETLGFFPTGTDFRLRTSNPLPGLVLEVGDETLAHWVQSAEINKTRLEGYSDYRREGVAADLGRSAIRYLMRASASRTQVDRLTVEALALGIASRGMAQLACLDDDIDSEINGWTRQARRREIDRAIDLIEARLTDNALSITDLADVACLSSSRFSSVFRSMIGETPYNFILRRRAEYARDLIIGTHEPLAQIAYASGFSSQAHMTVVVRRVFGTTPAALRDG